MLERVPRPTAAALTFSLPNRSEATGRVRITPMEPVMVFLRATMRLGDAQGRDDRVAPGLLAPQEGQRHRELAAAPPHYRSLDAHEAHHFACPPPIRNAQHLSRLPPLHELRRLVAT